MSDNEFAQLSLQNNLQYQADKLQIQSDALAQENAMKQDEFNAASNLAGNILALAKTRAKSLLCLDGRGEEKT